MLFTNDYRMMVSELQEKATAIKTEEMLVKYLIIIIKNVKLVTVVEGGPKAPNSYYTEV